MVQRTIEEMDQRLSKFEQMLSIVKGSNGNGHGAGLTAQQRQDVLGLVAARSSAVIGQEVTDPLVVGLPTSNGSVTSFSAGDLSPLFTTTETNVNTAPALGFAQIVQTANLIFAGPVSGGPVAPTFRALVADDLPAANLNIPEITASQALTDAEDGFWVDATANDVTVTLHDPRHALIKPYYFKIIFQAGAFKMILDGDGFNIDGTGTLDTAVLYTAFTLIPSLDEAQWFVV